MEAHLSNPILALNQGLALLPFDLGQKFWFPPPELLMRKFAVLPISSDLVETVHVKLRYGKGTCRTKLEKFECLK